MPCYESLRQAVAACWGSPSVPSEGSRQPATLRCSKSAGGDCVPEGVALRWVLFSLSSGRDLLGQEGADPDRWRV
jgi:hypothetical protein